MAAGLCIAATALGAGYVLVTIWLESRGPR